jgi:transketolase
VVLCNAGVIWGGIGPSHLSVEDVAAFRAVPNLVFLSPSDSVTAEKATYAAAEYVGPVILRLPAVGASFPTIYTQDLDFKIGKAISLRDGDDAAILATGTLVHDALVVADELRKKGIRVQVLDMPTIKPLDERAVLAAARRTGALVTVEDANILGGLGGAVSELTAEKCPVFVRRVGVRDEFGESGMAEEIKQHCGLTAPVIKKAVLTVLKDKENRKRQRELRK